MKKTGLFFIAAGFLVGVYFTVTHQTAVGWLPWSVAVIVGFVGVLFVRMADRAHAQDDTRVSENIALVVQSLDNIVAGVTTLNAEKEALNPYDVGPIIDERLLDDLDTFVEARETIGHVYGLQNYADVMAHFAGGERYLNRVWSASADGYIDEVRAYIGHALVQFTAARDKLAALSSA